MDDRTQESKKTVVAFVVGLLIGGLLVWIFAGSTESSTSEDASTRKDDTAEEKIDGKKESEKKTNTGTTTGTSTTGTKPGTGSFTVASQPAGMKVSLGDVQYPSEEGWVVVHDDVGGEFGWALGAARYHTGVGLLPKEVELLRATEKGKTYRVVFYTENGDRMFDLKEDVPMKRDEKLLEAMFVAQ